VGISAGLGECGNTRPPPGLDPRTVQPRSESLYRLSYPGSDVENTATYTYFV
jgi:hypothetical protein